MLHAYLIIGGQEGDRQKKAFSILENRLGVKIKDPFRQPDIIALKEEDSIKIDQIRRLKKWLRLKPSFLKLKAGLILEAQKLTPEAQNALLKTLEEPPQKSILILTSLKSEALLPTVVSRCQEIEVFGQKSLLPEEEKYHHSIVLKILSAKIGERLQLAEEIAKTKKEALKFIADHLVVWRQLMTNSITNKTDLKITPLEAVRNTKNIQKTYRLLKTNVNFRLAIENLLIAYPKTSG